MLPGPAPVLVHLPMPQPQKGEREFAVLRWVAEGPPRRVRRRRRTRRGRHHPISRGRHALASQETHREHAVAEDCLFTPH